MLQVVVAQAVLGFVMATCQGSACWYRNTEPDQTMSVVQTYAQQQLSWAWVKGTY